MADDFFPLEESTTDAKDEKKKVKHVRGKKKEYRHVPKGRAYVHKDKSGKEYIPSKRVYKWHELMQKAKGYFSY